VFYQTNIRVLFGPAITLPGYQEGMRCIVELSIIFSHSPPAPAKRLRQENGESSQSQSATPCKQAKIDHIRNALAGVTMMEKEEIRERHKAKVECKRKAVELEEQVKVAGEEAKVAEEQARQKL
jgi:hypothetical protein